METPAEKRRAKEHEARKRAKRADKEKAQAEKYGVTLVRRKSGGGGKKTGARSSSAKSGNKGGGKTRHKGKANHK